MTRKVNVFRAGAIDPKTREPAKELDYVGELHQFISQVDDMGVLKVAAIVEKPSGEVEAVILQNLQFVKPENQRWIDWHSGVAPIDPNAIVEVFYDTGEEDIGRADSFDWGSVGFGIAKYRVIS